MGRPHAALHQPALEAGPASPPAVRHTVGGRLHCGSQIVTALGLIHPVFIGFHWEGAVSMAGFFPRNNNPKTKFCVFKFICMHEFYKYTGMYKFLGVYMNKCTSQEMLSVSFSASFSHKFMWLAFCFPTKQYFGKECSQSFPTMAKLCLHGEPSKIVKIVLNTQSAKLKEVERKLVIKCPEQVMYSCISMLGRIQNMSFPLYYRSQLQSQTALPVAATLPPSIPFKLFITQWLNHIQLSCLYGREGSSVESACSTKAE